MSKVLVVGESSKDVFVYCHALRLAPDLPVPVLQIDSEIENPGMAMNVLRNLQALGQNSEIITNSNWEDVTKTRYMHTISNHMFVRVDSKNKIEPLNMELLHFDYDAIVISDYNKGFIDREAIEKICKAHPLVFIDTKKPLGPWANHAAYIKINDFEYERSRNSLTKLLEQKIIHTMGDLGCEFKGKRYPVTPTEVKDTSGAGDTFMASLVKKFMDTGEIVDAIIFANESASKVVQKKGVSLP